VNLRLIESWEALPRASEAYLQERVWFDLKLTYKPKSQPEMAKDVAAFANAVGGVLIIGAKEGLTAPDYSNPLQADYATRIEKEFDEAVRDYCRPSPTVHIRTIPVPAEDGKVIVVVNVEPFVDQPVAARYSTEGHAWRFPHRVGRHTEYLFPEQLPLYMNSKARRAKLMLERTIGAGGEVDIFTAPDGASRHANIQGPTRFAVESVDHDGGGGFVIRDHVGDLGRGSVTIPLDDVEAVWCQHTGRWAARVSGCLERMTSLDGEGSYELTYVPPGTFVVSPLGRVVDELSKHVRSIERALHRTLLVEHVRAEPNENAIAQRAYRIWERRMRDNVAGSADADWAHARHQLLRELRNTGA
jgi:hypothetical protein